MATKTAEKPAEVSEEEHAPITAVGYDANGEAVDIPVDTRPADTQGGLPGVEDDQPVEMFDGRRVTDWKYSLTGNTKVSRTNRDSVALFEAMRAEQPVTLLVTVVPGSVRYAPNTEDGHVVGFTRERKLHVTDVWAADADASELFEGGMVRVRNPDDEGPLPEVPESMYAPDAKPLDGDYADEPEGDLAASLMAAGLCGKRHRGHTNTCRAAAHACDLPEADEDE